MAEENERDGSRSEAADEENIFDVFEEPPPRNPNSFGKIPVVKDADIDLTDGLSAAEIKASADAEAAGLQHWTAPPTGQMPAVLSDKEAKSGLWGDVKGPSWHGDDPSWSGPDLADVFADTDSISLDSYDEEYDEDDEEDGAYAQSAAPRPAHLVEPPRGPRLDDGPRAHRAKPPPIAPAPERRPAPIERSRPEPWPIEAEPANAPLAPSGPEHRNGTPPPEAAEPPPLFRPGRGVGPGSPAADHIAPPHIDEPSAPSPPPPRFVVGAEVEAEDAGWPTGVDHRRSRHVFDSGEPTTVHPRSGTFADPPETEAPMFPGDPSGYNGHHGEVGLADGAFQQAPAAPAAAPQPAPVPALRPRQSPGQLPSEHVPSIEDIEFADPGAETVLPVPSRPEPRRPQPEPPFYDDGDEAIGLSPESRGELPKRLAVGVGLIAVVLGAMYFGAQTTLVLVVVLAMLGVVELYNSMRLAGLRPATLLGIVGTVAAPAAAYYRGDAAFPLILAMTVVFGTLWYLVGADTERPVLNLSLTMLGILWVGGLSAFAGLMLQFEGGVTLLLSAIVITAASDIMAYVGGRAYGKRPFHPASPKKTWEGTITGVLGALFAGFAIGVTEMGSVWDDNLVAAIVLGGVVGILAPVGDLAESVVKRDLGIKDMGHLLPGHGGVLDRVDALLFALPGTYYLALVYGLI